MFHSRCRPGLVRMAALVAPPVVLDRAVTERGPGPSAAFDLNFLGRHRSPTVIEPIAEKTLQGVVLARANE
jgi:hypothetical protein